MPDNITLNAGSGGATIRTVTKNAVETGVSMLDIGSGTTESLVTAANPLPVLVTDGTNQQGTSAHPFRVDPTGTTTQPVSLATSVAVTGTFWQATQPVSVAAPVAVTGTFWQTTQPVSAASLPLPTGAATAAKQPALGTAGSASADVLSVQGIASMTALKVDGSGVTQPVSGTFWQATQPVSGTVAATQSGTWNVGTVTTVTTVSAVTAISNALPAGTNTIGATIAAQQTNQLYNGTTALTPQFAAISASTSGDGNTIVAAQGAGKKIRVLRWFLSFSGAVNAKFRDFDGASTYTDLTGLVYGAAAGQPASGAYCPVGHFVTQANHALTLNLSAGTAVGGYLVYTVE